MSRRSWTMRLLCYLFLPFCVFLSVTFLTQVDLKAYVDISDQSAREIENVNVTVEGAANELSRVYSNSTLHPQYAYAFLVAGCNPDDPTYRGFLYNILVAIYSLWSSGSKAEYVILIQMAAKTKHEALPAQDVELFSKFTNNTMVHIQYLQKPKLDSFYQAMMSKFAVLSLTRYNRVLFLDADIMPLCNLDYIFELSEQGILKENVVMATRTEPANGGFFMLRPSASDYQLLLSIIQQQHDRAIRNSSYPFDYDLGWGHTIEPPDEWVTLAWRNNRGRIWYFHGCFADQGLLYHWVKYVKRNVSILFRNTVENWGPPPASQQINTNTSNTSPVLERIISILEIPGYGCPQRYSFVPNVRTSPYKDFLHFSGKTKPWEGANVPDDIDDPMNTKRPDSIWFHWLRKLNEEFQLSLNISTVLIHRKPVLGRFPILADMTALALADANLTK